MGDQVSYDPTLNTMQGWMSDEELVWLYEQAKKSKNVLEVGSWKGRSAHALASGCKGDVYCVDTFEGSEEQRDGVHAEAKEGTIEAQFRENTKGLDNIIVLRHTSLDAVQLFDNCSLGMVFIDGSHTRQNALNDIVTWLPKTKFLCGHDYEQASIKSIAEELNLEITCLPIGSLWQVERKVQH
jgi:hypothetical protein